MIIGEVTSHNHTHTHTQGHSSTLSTDSPFATVDIAATVDTVLVLFRVDPILDKQNINNAFLSKHVAVHARTHAGGKRGRARSSPNSVLEEVSEGV